MRTILTALAAAAIATAEAYACSCVQQTREIAFRNAGLVFDGVVERIDVAAGGQDRIDFDDYADPDLAAAVSDVVGRAATFRVEREIKGVGEAIRVIRYNIDTGGNCGMSFETGKRYRVFAVATAIGWVTGACDFTTELQLAPEALDYRAAAAAETFAKANPNDPVARGRLDRIRSEIDDEYFFRAYLDSVEVALEGGLPAIERAFLIAFDHEDYDRAEAIAAQGVERFGGDAGAHLMQAKALREREAFGDALAAAERALSLDPDDVDGRDEAERLRLVVKGEATPGRRDYRRLFARRLNARRCVAPRADFSESAFDDADFSGSNLEGARFRRVSAKKITFEKARLRNARFDQAGGGRNDVASRKGVSGFSAGFANADLRGAVFAHAMFTGADFSGADLRGADFAKASLEQAKFNGARLDLARFAGARFYSTRMDDAAIGRADFSGASAVNVSWRGADLSRAKLDGADLGGGVIDCGTRLPRGFAVAGSGLIPEQATCKGVKQNRDFAGIEWPYYLRLARFDLKGANFRKGEFQDSDFRGSTLTGADFSEASGTASFSGADLTGASFRGAKIRPSFTGGRSDGVEYANAVLDKTDFSGADLEALSFLSLDLSTATFDGAKMSCRANRYRSDVKAFDEFDADEDRGMFQRDFAHLKRERDSALRGLAAEGTLIRYLAGRWPAMVFDAACRSYLDGTE